MHIKKRHNFIQLWAFRKFRFLDTTACLQGQLFYHNSPHYVRINLAVKVVYLRRAMSHQTKRESVNNFSLDKVFCHIQSG